MRFVDHAKDCMAPQARPARWGLPLLLAVGMLTTSSLCAAPFVNLDFEAADTSNLSGDWGFEFSHGQGLLKDLLPGWSYSIGGTEYPGFFLNLLAMDGGDSLISLEALDYYRSQVASFFGHLFPWGMSGKYGLATTVVGETKALSQSGEVPLDARFISLDAYSDYGVDLQVNVDGVQIENGDISRYAGKTVQLQILMRRNPNMSGFSVSIDGVSFDPGPKLRLLTRPSVDLNADPLPRRDSYVVWNSIPTNYVLQTSSSLSGSATWQEIPPDFVFSPGAWGEARFVKLDSRRSASFFRLAKMR